MRNTALFLFTLSQLLAPSLTQPSCELGSEPDPLDPSACVPCSPGYYRSDESWESCYPCSPGRYQYFPNSTYCEPCFDGSYSLFPASQSCSLCSPGYYSLGTHQTSCNACPVNTFTDQVGAYECTPCTTWAINTPNSTVTAPFPSTVLAEGVSPIDCSVEFRTDSFLLFFFFLANPASITPANTRLYKRATTLAMGVHESNALLFGTPLDPSAVQDAAQLRQIILQAVGIDVFRPLLSFFNASASAQAGVGLLYFVVYLDTPDRDMAIATAQQIPTSAFKERLNLATASLLLPPVSVVPGSIQYYSPATTAILPVPKPSSSTPAPTQPPPNFSAGGRGVAGKWLAAAWGVVSLYTLNHR